MNSGAVSESKFQLVGARADPTSAIATCALVPASRNKKSGCQNEHGSMVQALLISSDLNEDSQEQGLLH